MAAKKIDYETILAYKQGDSEALNRVLVHHDKMITDAASKTIINDQGKKVSVYTGIGINKLRDMSNERNCDYVLFVGRKRMFKREALLRFLEESYSV